MIALKPGFSFPLALMTLLEIPMQPEEPELPTNLLLAPWRGATAVQADPCCQAEAFPSEEVSWCPLWVPFTGALNNKS